MKKITSILTMALVLAFATGLTSCQEFIDAIVGDHADNPSQPAPTPTPQTFDASTTPLTFEANVANTSVKFQLTGALANNYSTVEYSLDGGTTWTALTSADQEIELAAVGNKVMFRGTNASYNGNGKFVVTTAATAGTRGMTRAGSGEALCLIYGNIMSLIKSTGFADLKELTAANAGAFKEMFAGQPINVPSIEELALVLPATTLVSACYDNMFSGCENLTQTPALPAETLADNCYNGMFAGCTSLTEVSELPATELAEGCYNKMFSGCESLTEAPVLPAETLVTGCYSGMFENCENLTGVTVLATGVAEGATASDCMSNWLNGAGTNTEEAPVITTAEETKISASEMVAASGDATTTWEVKTEAETVKYAIVISDGTLFLNPKQEKTLTAKLSPTPEGNVGEISWKSSNEQVATVENGNVTAVGLGEATITATYGEDENAIKAECKVKVMTIELSETTLELTVGDEFTLSAKLLPEGTTAEFKWESTDVLNASVDQNGKITALKKGTALVAALYITDNGVIGGTCEVIVKEEENTLQAPDKFVDGGNPLAN